MRKVPMSIGKKCKKEASNSSIPANSNPSPSHERGPTRHVTGERSLQSESSLKGHLQC